MSQKELKDALRRQWSQLSDKRRLKWISKALELQKDYEVPEPNWTACHSADFLLLPFPLRHHCPINTKRRHLEGARVVSLGVCLTLTLCVVGQHESIPRSSSRRQLRRSRALRPHQGWAAAEGQVWRTANKTSTVSLYHNEWSWCRSTEQVTRLGDIRGGTSSSTTFGQLRWLYLYLPVNLCNSQTQNIKSTETCSKKS